MKDSEFIELLNLYLDHEISAADAARLEAEVLGNPARRSLYQDYCRMQKACRLLGQDFAIEAPARDDKVVAFEAGVSTSRRTGFYAVGGLLAAAACLTFIFVARNNDRAPTMPARADMAAVAAPNPERAIGRTVSMPAATEEPRAVLVNALSLGATSTTRTADSNSLFVATDRGATPFEWMRTVQLAPVQRLPIEEFRFDAHAPQSERFYKVGAPHQGTQEFNAIRYTK